MGSKNAKRATHADAIKIHDILKNVINLSDEGPGAPVSYKDGWSDEKVLAMVDPTGQRLNVNAIQSIRKDHFGPFFIRGASKKPAKETEVIEALNNISNKLTMIDKRLSFLEDRLGERYVVNGEVKEI